MYELGEWIRSEDIRQWTFCPRIYYYKVFGGRSKQQTMKMMLGKMIHDEYTLSDLWKEMKLEGEVKLNKYIIAREERLKAQIDMIYTKKKEGREKMIIEIKTGKKYDQISNHHLAQVNFQAYSYEKATKEIVTEIGIYYVKGNKLERREYTKNEEKKVKEMITEMREMKEMQLIPEVPYTRKCEICEQKRRCWG